MQVADIEERIKHAIEALRKVEIEKKEIPLFRALVLYVLNKVHEPVGKLKLQKLVFLAATAGGAKEIVEEYMPYKFGMFSESIKLELEFLEANNYIVERKEKFYPTEKTRKEEKEIVKALENALGKKALERIDNALERFKDLSENELLVLLYSMFPEYAQYSEIKNKVERLKKKVAIELYRKGKISLLLAAKIAGLAPQEIEKIASEG